MGFLTFLICKNDLLKGKMVTIDNNFGYKKTATSFFSEITLVVAKS